MSYEMLFNDLVESVSLAQLKYYEYTIKRKLFLEELPKNSIGSLIDKQS